MSAVGQFYRPLLFHSVKNPELDRDCTIIMLFFFVVLVLTVSAPLAMQVLAQVKAIGCHLPLTRVARPIQRQLAQNPAHVLENGGLVTNIRDFAYLVHVNIGKQEFSLSFDTGSSDLWIVSSNCTAADCQGVPKYNEHFQTSLSMTELPFELTYLLGSVSGMVDFETVTLGVYEISSQVFALVNRTAGLQLSGTGNSGILGLAFPSTAAIPPTSGKTILENILSYFDESDRFFAFHLGRDRLENRSSNDTTSSFTIAQLDPVITDDLDAFAYTPVSLVGGASYDYWKLPLQGLTINAMPLPLSLSLVPGAQAPIAVLDTGTTMVLGPSVDVEAFWLAVGGNVTRKNAASDMWEVRCDRGVDVGFVLGEKGNSKEYAVHPADINIDEGGNLDGWCVGGIQANDGVNSGDWLLGDVFLRNVYVTHHTATSTEPPLIGLFSMTDQKLASDEFRNERGPDLAPNSSGQFRNAISRYPRPKKATVYSLSCVGGFVGGVVVTLLFRVRRRLKSAVGWKQEAT